MRQYAGISLIVVLSCLGTLHVANPVWPSRSSYYYRADPQYGPGYSHSGASRGFFQRPISYDRISYGRTQYPQVYPQPYHQAWYPPVRPQSYVLNAKDAARYRQGSPNQVNRYDGTRRGSTMRQVCSPDNCGEGCYWCSGECKFARKVVVEFAADFKGKLNICGWDATEWTTGPTDKKNYDGPIPCGEYLYVDIANDKGTEGGASIGIEYHDDPHLKKGTGNNLGEEQIVPGIDGGNYWATPHRFTYWDGKFPYSDLNGRYGANPVKDSRFPQAESTTIRFKGC